MLDGAPVGNIGTEELGRYLELGRDAPHRAVARRGPGGEIDICFALAARPFRIRCLVAGSLLLHGKRCAKMLPWVERLTYRSRKLPASFLQPRAGRLRSWCRSAPASETRRWISPTCVSEFPTTFAEESIEAKARWFQSLTMEERMEVLDSWTELVLQNNPRLIGIKDAIRLRDVFASLISHDVRYLVIGGTAAVLHGVPRATFDPIS